MRLRAYALAAFGLSLCAVRPAAANAVLGDFGLGARGAALAGAVTASIDDWTASFYNPAGLAREFETEITAGLQYGASRLQNTGPDANVDDVFGALFGVKLGLPLGSVLRERIVMGLSAFINVEDLSLSTIKVPRRSAPTFVNFESHLERLLLHLGVGVKLHEALTVGVGVFVHAFESPNSISGLIGAQRTFEVTGDLALEGKFFLLGGIVVDGGGLHESLEGWRLGVVFRERTSQHFSLPASLNLGFPAEIDIRSELVYTPREVAFGIAYERDRLTVEVDLAWRDWSEFPSPYATVGFRSLDVLLPGVPDILSLPFDPRYKDVWVPRGSVEYRIEDEDRWEWALRGGYAYIPSPVPNQRGDTNIADSDKHYLSFGLGVTAPGWMGLEFPRPVSLDAYASITHYERREFRKNANVPADNPGYPRLRVSGNLLAFGLQLTFRF